MDFSAFFSAEYMPHGHCFLWLPSILWLTVLSDALIAIAYFSIPVALFIFVRKRPELRFKNIFLLFAAFITLCGLTHLFGIYNIWNGAYGMQAILKSLTAMVSIATAIVIFKSIRPALAMPTVQDMEEAMRLNMQKEGEIARLEMQRKADALFRTAIDFLPTGVVVIDSNQRVVMVNSTLEKMFGYGAGELRDSVLDQLIPADSRGVHHSLVDSFMKTQQRGRDMARGRVVEGKQKDGSSVSVEVSLVSGEVEGESYGFASVNDIGQVISSANAFVSNGNRWMRAIRAADEGIWEWNVTTDEVWYSPRLLELIGRDKESESYGVDDWFASIHPEDRDRVQHALDTHFSDRTPYIVQYRGLKQDGSYAWRQARGEAQFNASGQPLLMSGTLTDIDQTVRLGEELKEQVRLRRSSETEFVNTFEQAAVGIAHVGLDGKWIRVNSRLCEILGYSEDELLTTDFQSLTYEDDLKTDLDFVQSLIDGTADTYSLEKRYVRRGGDVIWTNLTVSVVREASEADPKQLKPQYFISVVEDISKRKSVERELEDSNRALERFAYSASHDLQEPMRKISMFSDRLAKRLEDQLQDENASYELERIGDAAQRMKRMIDALLVLSRVGQGALHVETISLKDVVAQVTESMSTLIQEQKAEIILEKDGELDVDREGLAIVLQNLFSNAIRYAKSGIASKIRVNLHRGTKYYELSVSDNGIGIPEAQRSSIFEPFVRMGPKDQTGSGIGLAICKRVIDRHHGTIDVVDADSDQQGSLFLIRIPIITRDND